VEYASKIIKSALGLLLGLSFLLGVWALFAKRYCVSEVSFSTLLISLASYGIYDYII